MLLAWPWLPAAPKAQNPPQAIHDVVWSDGRQPDSDGKLPAVGNTVDLETATYENSIGATQLIGVFHDSDFDPTVKSVYYMRVLEIPTPR